MVVAMDIYDRAKEMIAQAMELNDVKTVEALANAIDVNPSTLKNWRNGVSSPLNAKAVYLKRLADAAGEDYGDFYRYLDIGERAPKRKALVDHRVARAIALLNDYYESERGSGMEEFCPLVHRWFGERDIDIESVSSRHKIPIESLQLLKDGGCPILSFDQVSSLISEFGKNYEVQAADFFPPVEDDIFMIGDEAPTKDRPKFPQRNGHGKA